MPGGVDFLISGWLFAIHNSLISLATPQVKMRIDIELSYMNTNHPDFIGFANASSPQAKQMTASGMGSQTIRKGWLSIASGGMLNAVRSKEAWFVLTAESLTWYKDDEEREMKFQLALEGVKIAEMDGEGGFMKKKNVFSLFSPDRKNIYKDHKTLDLAAQSPDDVESWCVVCSPVGALSVFQSVCCTATHVVPVPLRKASLLRAGVYPVNHVAQDDEAAFSTVDPQLERQVGYKTGGFADRPITRLNFACWLRLRPFAIWWTLTWALSARR